MIVVITFALKSYKSYKKNVFFYGGNYDNLRELKIIFFLIFNHYKALRIDEKIINKPNPLMHGRLYLDKN